MKFFQNFTNLDDHTQQTTDIPGFKPSTHKRLVQHVFSTIPPNCSHCFQVEKGKDGTQFKSLFFIHFCQGEEQHLIKCCRCNAIVGNVTNEDAANVDFLEFDNVASIYLYKHRISLMHSNLFRYARLHLHVSNSVKSQLQALLLISPPSERPTSLVTNHCSSYTHFLM